MAPEEVFERLMSYVRPSGFAPEISPDPALLRQIGSPAVQRWVCGRLDGVLSRSAGCSQGSEGILDE